MSVKSILVVSIEGIRVVICRDRGLVIVLRLLLVDVAWWDNVVWLPACMSARSMCIQKITLGNELVANTPVVENGDIWKGVARALRDAVRSCGPPYVDRISRLSLLIRRIDRPGWWQSLPCKSRPGCRRLSEVLFIIRVACGLFSFAHVDPEL